MYAHNLSGFDGPILIAFLSWDEIEHLKIRPLNAIYSLDFIMPAEHCTRKMKESNVVQRMQE